MKYKLTLALETNQDSTWNETLRREFVGSYLVGVISSGGVLLNIEEVEEVIEWVIINLLIIVKYAVNNIMPIPNIMVDTIMMCMDYVWNAFICGRNKDESNDNYIRG